MSEALHGVPSKALSDAVDPASHLPELLCPVGSPAALDAAIEGGADALYLGGSAFNARMNAANFDREQLRDAIRRAHAYGVKVYLTLNTLMYDREQKDYLHAAYDAAADGIDALIVADIGGASLIHRALPSLPLHASTQMSAHNAQAGEQLAAMGFCRMVVARELCYTDLCRTVQDSPIEVEAFVHGALCVCHSGQCLFSSLVGGRSGNRGECAQPCRLPYRADGETKEGYPLSLKDLSLAAHVPALLRSGVASLKIEGRMKSPAYVLTVSRIWRRLLDERRAATPDEMRALADAFSRGGFTDGYFTRKLNRSMLGVRSQQDKQQSLDTAPAFDKITRAVPLDLSVSLREGVPMTCTATTAQKSVTVTGAIPEKAKTAPITREVLQRQFSKLGGTPYTLQSAAFDLGEGLMVPISALNELRRAAVEALLRESPPAPSQPLPAPPVPPQCRNDVREEKTARFTYPHQLTPAALRSFAICYLPLTSLVAQPDLVHRITDGGSTPAVILPEVIPPSAYDTVGAMLDTVLAAGVKRAMVGNLGHLALAAQREMMVDGDFRLNVTNAQSAAVLHRMGLSTLLLSPELSLPQIRDIPGAVRTIVYGRIPLMLLEKCATHELYSCKTCDAGEAALLDRRGARFPMLRAYDHRTLIVNSVPTYLADRADELKKHNVGGRHFIFTTESPQQLDAVLTAYEQGTPASMPIRRIGV